MHIYICMYPFLYFLDIKIYKNRDYPTIRATNRFPIFYTIVTHNGKF